MATLWFRLSNTQGCLDALQSQRYIAYSSDDFKYIYTPDEGEPTTYDLEDIMEELNASAEADNENRQTLTVNSYDA